MLSLEFTQLINSFFVLNSTLFKLCMTFLAVDITSFLLGSVMLINESTNVFTLTEINSLSILCIIFNNSSLFFLFIDIIAFQAFALSSFTCFFIVFSISSNSSFELILFEIIHSLIFELQSKRFSQSNRSVSLYLSWDPDVEWPKGWVRSVTWIKIGIWFSLQVFSAFS